MKFMDVNHHYYDCDDIADMVDEFGKEISQDVFMLALWQTFGSVIEGKFYRNSDSERECWFLFKDALSLGYSPEKALDLAVLRVCEKMEIYRELRRTRERTCVLPWYIPDGSFTHLKTGQFPGVYENALNTSRASAVVHKSCKHGSMYDYPAVNIEDCEGWYCEPAWTVEYSRGGYAVGSQRKSFNTLEEALAYADAIPRK